MLFGGSTACMVLVMCKMCICSLAASALPHISIYRRNWIVYNYAHSIYNIVLDDVYPICSYTNVVRL